MMGELLSHGDHHWWPKGFHGIGNARFKSSTNRAPGNILREVKVNGGAPAGTDPVG